MSERIQSRIDNFDANKAKAEQAQFEDALYGEAGATDFSDSARARLQEADAYEQHLQTMADRGAAGEDEYYDTQVRTDNSYMEGAHDEALAMNAEHDQVAAMRQAEFEQRVQANAQVRRMEMIAADVARLNASEVTADTEGRMTQAVEDKQDKLSELLVQFNEQATDFTNEERDLIMSRIIDMTETASAPALEAENPVVEQPAEQSLLPNYTAEEVASRLDAVRRVRAESEAEQASEQQPEVAPEAAAEVEDDVPLSTEGINDITPEQAAEEGESQKEYEARNGVEADDDEPLSTEGIRDIEVEAEEEAEEQSKWRRIGSRFTPTNIAARASALLHTMKRNRNSNETTGEAEDTEESREAMTRKKKVLIGLGILSTAVVVGVAAKYGIDVLQGDAATDANEALKNRSNGNSNGGGNNLNWKDFDPSARRIHDGEGFFSTFKQMGIPKENWGEILKDAGPKLGKMGEAYYDNSANEWRISHEGVFSNDALQEIAKSAQSNGVKLR